MYPQSVRDKMCALHGHEATSDGRRWPRPELVKLAAGDAVLVMHAVPHGGRCDICSPPLALSHLLDTRALLQLVVR